MLMECKDDQKKSSDIDNVEINWMEEHTALLIIFLLILLVIGVILILVAILCKRRHLHRRNDGTGSSRNEYVNTGYVSETSCRECIHMQQLSPYSISNCNGCLQAYQPNRTTTQNIFQRPPFQIPVEQNLASYRESFRPNYQNQILRQPTQNEHFQRALAVETPPDYSDNDNQDDPDETRPISIANQEMFANIPSQLLVVSNRSRTITVENKEVVFIAKKVTSKGENLILDGMGISLFVPPGAVKDGEIKTIVLVLNWDLSDNPVMTEKQALVSPVVYVGPHNLKLEKQCTLCFKHCSFDKRHIKVMKSETELVDTKQWQEHCSLDSDTGCCVITPDECQLKIDTFTLYTCLQSPSDTEDCRKWLQIAAFSSPLKPNLTHQQIRLYFLNKTPCALQWAIQNEAKFGGQMMGPEKVYLFYGNAQDMYVNLRYLSDGWENVDKEIEEHVPYINIWHGKCPHITMCFKKHLYPREITFKLFLYQYLLENEGGNFIVHMTEDTNHGSDTGTGNASGNHEIVLKLPGRPNDLRDSGHTEKSYGNSHVHVHINHDSQTFDLDQIDDATRGYYPYELKVSLKVLLDPSCPFDKNWRAFASALGKERCIRYLETKDSPTELLLSHAESRKLSLETLAEILSCIDREDASQLVRDFIPHTDNGPIGNRPARAVENPYNYNITRN